MVNIGSYIRRWRRSHDISQAAMAREVNISRVWLNKLENGHVMPSDELIERINMYMEDYNVEKAN